MIEELIAGDTLDFLDSVPEYPPADGWTLRYYLVPQFATPVQATIVIEAITEGADYRTQEAAGVTATWPPGKYTWTRRVEKAGPINQSIGTGVLAIKPNLATVAQGYDGRSHARKMLDTINAAMEAFSIGVKQYTIGSRSMTKQDIPELLTLRDRYRAEVANEEAAAKVAAGMANPRSVGIRFQRP